MRRSKLHVVRETEGKSFRLRRLALHELMPPSLVDRPEGTGDHLFMLFHDEARVGDRRGDFTRPAGSLMIWTPRDGHFYGSNLGPWDHSWFHCAGRDIPRILRASRIRVGEVIPLADPLILENFLLEAAAELNGWRRPDETVLRNLFENFVRRLARHIFRKSERLAPAELLVLRAYVGERFAEKLRLADLARRVGWSVPHLCTEFKRYFGLPVVQYIMQIRMNQAAYLLRDHNRRIGDIAGMVGYPDPYTFSKMFKRSFGLSPRHFRQRMIP
ncbi:MAG TPA: AraC family transcriptional regulator [Lacunisphaera sp.]